jgi:hypothetical protein
MPRLLIEKVDPSHLLNEPTRAHPQRHIAHFVRDQAQWLLIGVAANNRQQAILYRHSHTDIDRSMPDDRIAIE